MVHPFSLCLDSSIRQLSGSYPAAIRLTKMENVSLKASVLPVGSLANLLLCLHLLTPSHDAAVEPVTFH